MLSDTDRENGQKNLDRSCAFIKLRDIKMYGEDYPVMIQFITNDGFDATRFLAPFFLSRYIERFGSHVKTLMVSLANRNSLIIAPYNSAPAQFKQYLQFLSSRAYHLEPYPIVEQLIIASGDEEFYKQFEAPEKESESEI